MGWAGQTIQDMSGNRVPWFGRGGRGKGGLDSPGGRSCARNGGRGRGGGFDVRGGSRRSMGRRQWGAGADHGAAGCVDGLSVDKVVDLVRHHARDQPLPNAVFEARPHARRVQLPFVLLGKVME